MSTEFINKPELKAYVLSGMPKKNDYSILAEGDLERITDALIEFEEAYINSITPNADGELEYDDQAAFDMISKALKEEFPQYLTFCEAMTNDYMDLSEEFLTESGDIDWE